MSFLLLDVWPEVIPSIPSPRFHVMQALEDQRTAPNHALSRLLLVASLPLASRVAAGVCDIRSLPCQRQLRSRGRKPVRAAPLKVKIDFATPAAIHGSPLVLRIALKSERTSVSYQWSGIQIPGGSSIDATSHTASGSSRWHASPSCTSRTEG